MQIPLLVVVAELNPLVAYGIGLTLLGVFIVGSVINGETPKPRGGAKVSRSTDPAKFWKVISLFAAIWLFIAIMALRDLLR